MCVCVWLYGSLFFPVPIPGSGELMCGNLSSNLVMLNCGMLIASSCKKNIEQWVCWGIL